MLGQLLHSINPARRIAPRAQDVSSQIEDVHTKGLLFPDAPYLRDADALLSSNAGSEPPDCHMPADLDLDASRDVRILIAQGETFSIPPVLLFDSKHDPSADATRIRHTRTGSRGDGSLGHSRTASGPPRQYGKLPAFASIPESNGRESPAILSPTSATGTPQRSRFRRSSLTNVEPEVTSVGRQKEMDDTVKVALDCMFENAPTTYKGISNKIKIVQRETKPYDATICRDTFGNQFAPSHGQRSNSTVRKPSTLSSSFTASESAADFRQSSAVVEDTYKPDLPRRTVLITRTFSVKWSEEDASGPGDLSDAEKHASDAANPTVIIDDERENKKPEHVQRPRRLPGRPAPKPPMFAITIVLSLPVSAADLTRPESRSGGLRRQGSDVNSAWNSLASSLDSGAVMDPLFAMESSAASLGSDVDDRVDKVIGQHWDIIVRTLSSIQTTAEARIIRQLKSSTSRGRPPKLMLHTLAQDAVLKKAADQACVRLVRGIRILRVRTGQGRWGVWREEARWLNRWANEKEKTTFLFNLCTAFLGTHTEWLNIAGPKYYRQQHREQLRLGSQSEPAVPNRTVIVCGDKMIARRFIFLLSAFLPANHHSTGDSSPLRPSTSASVRAFSQSPPAHIPLSREESLRRTINRRGGKRSSSRHATGSSKTPQQNSAPSDTDDMTETGTVRSVGEAGHSRRQSFEIRSSVRNKLALTADVEPAARKSSATISPTVNPGLQMPSAHIGFQRRYSSGQDVHQRPESQDSLASENLMQTLQRSNTGTSIESQSGVSRWGSLRSLWSMGSRRDSQTNYSDSTQQDDEGLGIIGLQHTSSQNKLQHMVNELETERAQARQSLSPAVPITPEIRSPEMETPPILSSSKPIDVPLKLSVNERDGVIDVEFPGFSPLNSPPIGGYHSGSSYGSFGYMQSSVTKMPQNTGHAMNVAGFLKVGIHPDFELQATPPYASLIDDVKAAMSAEPTPIIRRTMSENEPIEQWVDVCKTVIADTETFTTKRLRLRRLVRYMPPSPPPAVTPMALPRRGLQIKLPPRSQYGNPYDDSILQLPVPVTVEQVFTEEKVADLDRSLMDALERVISQPKVTPGSSNNSAPNSRANSVRGRNGMPKYDDPRYEASSEVPQNECKKMIIGALEQIATAVERDRRDARRYGGARLRSLNDEAESSLRDGIARWYDEIERNKKAIEAQKADILKEGFAPSQAASTFIAQTEPQEGIAFRPRRVLGGSALEAEVGA